jgi:hypothetical protein
MRRPHLLSDKPSDSWDEQQINSVRVVGLDNKGGVIDVCPPDTTPWFEINFACYHIVTDGAKFYILCGDHGIRRCKGCNSLNEAEINPGVKAVRDAIKHFMEHS